MGKRLNVSKNALYIFILSLIFFQLIFITGCKTSQQNKELIVGINQIKTLNPFLITTIEEQTIANLIYGSLFINYDNLKKFEPLIAKDFIIKENYVKIKLKNDYKDSDGNKIDKEFLIEYFSYFQKRSYNDDNSFIPDIKGLIIEADIIEGEQDSIFVKSEENLNQIDFMKKVGHLFTFPIISPKIFDKIQNKNEYFYKYGSFEKEYSDIIDSAKDNFINNDSIISTGLWEINSISNDYIKLSKIINKGNSENYKNSNNSSNKSSDNIKTLIFQIYEQSDIIIKKLVSKEIDICFGDFNDANFLKDFYSIKTLTIDDPDSFYIMLMNFQSSNLGNRNLINDLNFRKWIYNNLYQVFKNEKYFSPAQIRKKILKPNVVKEKFNEEIMLSLFAFQEDLIAQNIARTIHDNLKKNGLNVKIYSENLNSIIARIYATKNWDFLITTLSTDYPFLMDFELYNPLSYHHIFNINIDSNNDFILLFENEIYQKIYSNYKFILKNPTKIYSLIEDMILKYCLFIPVYQLKNYIFINNKVKKIKANIVRKGFYLDF